MASIYGKYGKSYTPVRKIQNISVFFAQVYIWFSVFPVYFPYIEGTDDHGWLHHHLPLAYLGGKCVVANSDFSVVRFFCHHWPSLYGLVNFYPVTDGQTGRCQAHRPSEAKIDIEVSPPASVWYLWESASTLILIRFCFKSWLFFFPVSLLVETYFRRYEFFSSLIFGLVNFGSVADRQKAMHSPPSISTGVLVRKKHTARQSWFIIYFYYFEVLIKHNNFQWQTENVMGNNMITIYHDTDCWQHNLTLNHLLYRDWIHQLQHNFH